MAVTFLLLWPISSPAHDYFAVVWPDEEDISEAVWLAGATEDETKNFIANNSGGIIVKEMLAKSSGSSGDAYSIVGSTSAMRMGTNSAILDTLRLRTADLERAQDSFSDLWNKHNFQVKNLRESLRLIGISLGVLGSKVVPDYSSLIGDPRERAETIQANHMDMCRFKSSQDLGYE
ncbi:hypothetical protein BKA67DRAFT_677731 [Truncatella angustata]|uniref:Uncharacterized protein n=1 Tax=Truncatella angustata TaxID=152316 RepID=A0A9P8UI91_9PEZI|nr:uncharacterized protein BKA67DRAFT_677731 [Truncatella angustata]KAH6652642.1 hypothetical protein BKA67DRAFT_677731 [Truncatella angustata]